MAANLGFNATLVTDATATYARVGSDGQIYSADCVNKVSLASFQDEFCQLSLSSDILLSL